MAYQEIVPAAQGAEKSILALIMAQDMRLQVSDDVQRLQ